MVERRDPWTAGWLHRRGVIGESDNVRSEKGYNQLTSTPTYRRIKFALRLAGRRISSDNSCPYCAAANSRRLATKYFLLELRKCEACGLQWRWPKDSAKQSRRFYQGRYRERGITDLPSEGELADLLTSGFEGTPLDLSRKIALMAPYVPSHGLVLDYGSSWGYGLAQMAAEGWQCIGYEIAQRRAEYATGRLGQLTYTDSSALEDDLVHSCNAILASHVLEHLWDPKTFFRRIARLLVPGGRVFIFTPNAGGAKARRLGPHWGPLIGEKHVLAVDTEWLRTALPEHGLEIEVFKSSPYRSDSLDGDELLTIARRSAS